MTYPNTQLFINGQWQDAASGKTLAVFNPATGQEIGRVAHAGIADLDAALAAAQKGFEKPGATCPPSSATRSCAAPPR
jgi:succinate-semialdehyde dehydrogenase/glutarate-semialdehyde dehydrogenase